MKSDSRSPQFGIGHWLTGVKGTSKAALPSSGAEVTRVRKAPGRRPIFRGLYLLYRIFAWLRYVLPRRFDRSGLGVAGALALAMIMVPDTENNVAYQAFTVLLFTLLVAASFSLWFRARFAVTRVLPRFATVGAVLRYTVSLHNLSNRRQRGLMLLENLAEPRPGYREWLEVQLADERRFRSFRFTANRSSSFKKAALGGSPVPTLLPGGKADVHMQLTPLRRGVLRLAGVTVARTDPLGLVRAFSRVQRPENILVLPKRYYLPPLALPGSMKYQQGGVALASSVGQSEEFVSLRDYRHGDPLRHIHWRSWAKAGRPVVKEFEDEFFVRHALILDTFWPQPRSEAFEEAVSVAASFACTIRTQESLLDLLFVGPESYCFTAGRGLANADQMLEILASVRTCPDQPFATLEHLVVNHIRQVSGCICVLLSWDNQRREFVRKLQELNLPLLVLVIVEVGQAVKIGRRPDDPERFLVLETGGVERGLLNLK